RARRPSARGVGQGGSLIISPTGWARRPARARGQLPPDPASQGRRGPAGQALSITAHRLAGPASDDLRPVNGITIQGAGTRASVLNSAANPAMSSWNNSPQ